MTSIMIIIIYKKFQSEGLHMKDLILENHDYKYLNWTKIRSSSGTAGSFLKATETIKGKKVYYKLSNYDSINGIVGHECVNELIVSRLLDVLDITHLQYELIHGDVTIEDKVYNTYFCRSESFRKKEERKMTFEMLFQMQRKNNETALEFAVRKCWQKEIYQMLLVDFLILNRDRHGANIEIIMDKNGNERMAPLFDHGLSLLFNCNSKSDVEQYDVLEDKPIQSFLGSKSAKKNLEMILNDGFCLDKKLSLKDKNYIFEGLDGILSPKHIDKIWEMIWERWQCYENMLNI